MTMKTAEGPYRGRSGAVMYSFPHGTDKLVALCDESDPARLADMLNYALAKGYERACAQPEVKVKRTRRRRVGANCLRCGQERVRTGKVSGQMRCKGCQDAYRFARTDKLKTLTGAVASTKAEGIASRDQLAQAAAAGRAAMDRRERKAKREGQVNG